MKDIPLNERIIFALDFAHPGEAMQWVEKLDSTIKFFKVGLQLFLAGGWPVVDHITERGNKVMLDLKFFDIPETVHQAVQQVRNHGVTFATIHGNDAIVKAAVQDKADLQILAVTVLTSFDESDMRQMGLTGPVEDMVRIRARKALEAGCDGVVSSPLETPALRRELGQGFFTVTPGIRPSVNHKIAQDDQRRTASPGQAITNGADYLVIGRPIRTAPNPLSLINTLQHEIAAATA
ncbi:MAG: orotidine-5'-phosphate decarboxylase [Deltaproteobacteria bacterium]|nr:orotidine-5'-phosphate decarboxylase [Deltaproteobacteria bacterium]